MVKVSVNRYIQTRIRKMKQKTQTELDKLRKMLMKNLEEVFQTAGKIVKGETQHQRINGKLVKITLRQRKKWLKIAEKTALTIQSIAANIDEKELKTQLEELEMLLNETKKEAIQKPQTDNFKDESFPKKEPT